MRALSAMAFGLALLTPQAVPISRTPTEGETQAYTIRMETTFEGTPLVFINKTTDKVTGVNMDGSFDVTTTTTESKILFNGQESPGPEISDVITTFAKTGEVINMAGESVDDDAVRLSRMIAVVWPTRPVNKGAGWETVIKKNEDKGYADVRIAYTFEDNEKIGERDALRLGVVAEELQGEAPCKINGKIWIDATTGILLKMEHTMKDAPIAGNRYDIKLLIEPAS